MTLRIAIQMDPISGINPDKGDTTIAFAFEAQARGYELYYYRANNLFLREGEVYALAYPVTFMPGKAPFYQLGGRKEIKLRDKIDIVLMRQDPPFDMNYLSYSYMLEKLMPDCWVINDPVEVRNCPEKLFPCDFPELMAPTLIARNEKAILDFWEEHGDIVLKPLYAFGGRDVFRFKKGDTNLVGVFDMLERSYQCPVVAQAFIPDVYESGDKRILLLDGMVMGALTRTPAKGNVRSNLASGGTAHKTELSDADKHICETIGPELKKRGLVFVGIDVIGGKLTEINVTSPTGLVNINQLENVKLEADFWDYVEKKWKSGKWKR